MLSFSCKQGYSSQICHTKTFTELHLEIERAIKERKNAKKTLTKWYWTIDQKNDAKKSRFSKKYV